MSYPEGWTARAATEPWTDQPGVVQFLHPGFDVLQDPARDNLFLWITSRPIGDSTPEDWVETTVAGWECTTTEPIVVDGATGLIGAHGLSRVCGGHNRRPRLRNWALYPH